MKIQLERVGPGHYRHDGFEINRIHHKGDRPFWILIEYLHGRQRWLTRGPTLREVRERLITELLRRERVAGSRS